MVGAGVHVEMTGSSVGWGGEGQTVPIREDDESSDGARED